MRRRTRLVAFLALLAVGLISGLPWAGSASAASPTDEQGFVSKINKERMDRGLRPLIFDMKIRDVARAWTDHMASTGDFSHNPDYAKQIPAGWSSAAENIAWGSGTNATVDALHTGFMNSQGHRDNILGDFTRVGVGVTMSGDKMWVTEDFGKYAGDPIPNADGSVGGSGSGGGTYVLTVTKKGKGAVSSAPAGISCGSDCTESYASGATVTLTAAPKSGRTVTWSGACTGSAATCTVTMTAAKTVKATFV